MIAHEQGTSAPARHSVPTRDIVSEVRARLETTDLRAALGCLNARTRFRFTGIYHADPPLLRNIHLFDRENPTLNVSGAVTALDVGYCGVVFADDEPFSTADARHDPRLSANSARDTIISYVGVPIRTPDGRAWGSLCHYDLRPRLILSEELSVLSAVMPLFVDCLRDRYGV